MKDTIDMAREAGIDAWWNSGSDWREKFDEHLKAFEALVRADERSAERGEPVAWMDADGDVYKSEPHPNWCPPHVPLCIIPSQRKPSHKEFMEWAGKEGYDTAYTVNSDTGKFIALSPMTADLWKAWQAAHSIKEKNT